VSGASSNACPGCGDAFPSVLNVFGPMRTQLTCRECSAEARRIIHWVQGVAGVALVAVAIVVGTPMGDTPWRLAVAGLLIVLWRATWQSYRINRAWPGIRARAKVFPKFETRDGPPPHTPIPPPSDLPQRRD